MSLAKANQLYAYKDTEILTADQGKLIVMLYDGAIRFLSTASENMNHRTYDIVNTNIKKAQDIVTELMLSLNMNDGGEVAQNLFNIYAYMKKRLLESNIKKDASIIQEVLNLLTELRSAWEEAAKTESRNQIPTRAAGEKTAPKAGFSIQG